MAKRPANKSSYSSVAITETPFNKRHCCWFCGEPSQSDFVFPPENLLDDYYADQEEIPECPHPRLSVPSCGECYQLASRSRDYSVWAVKGFVKRLLLKYYAKDLAIGTNWTREELASSEFEQGNFAGFARSAWFMYEVAKGRVSYAGWPLVVNGLELDDNQSDINEETFLFDGISYPSLADAINHFAKMLFLEPHYFNAVLKQLSHHGINTSSFAKTIRFCRLQINATPDERKVAFKKLINLNSK